MDRMDRTLLSSHAVQGRIQRSGATPKGRDHTLVPPFRLGDKEIDVSREPADLAAEVVAGTRR
ncbi:MAG: hypothetical protein H0V23_06915 [Nocardioidaceae bacterium]|nr:hypothetical protein [Nocardioidaceae bacterium]